MQLLDAYTNIQKQPSINLKMISSTIEKLLFEKREDNANG